MEVTSWLVDWFQKNTSLEQAEIEGRLNENYFEKGWIDSFKFMSLITDIETKFKLVFSNEDFQNREFSTIKGIAEIIERRRLVGGTGKI